MPVDRVGKGLFMNTKLAVLSCVLLLALNLGSKSSSADGLPNVLFIAIDDLNDWVGCMKGHPQAQTPNIDRLAARGMLFSNAHCAAPACNPSRAAVFSGRMPNVSKVWSNDSGPIRKVYPGSRDLPTALNEAGYHTAGTGKLFGKQSDQTFQQYQSYEQRWSPFSGDAVEYSKKELSSKGTRNPRHLLQDSLGRDVVLPINRMPSDRRPNEKKGESFDWGGFDLPDTDWGDTRSANWAIDRLGDQHEKPLFLGVGFYRPHIPLFAPLRFFERFKDDPGTLPPYRQDDLDDLSLRGKSWALEAVTAGLHSTVVEYDQWQTAVESYLACVTYVDHEVGRVLDALDNSSMADNTLVVLWSDHGWQLGEKDHWGKWTGWERSTKVPLIIVPPKNQAAEFATAGSVCDAPVGLIDLYPTLLEFCRIEGPAILDGDSLVPLLKKPKSRYRNTTLTMFEQGNASVRDLDWRYLQYADGSEELYHLKHDPNEWTNLAAIETHVATKLRLRAELENHLARFETGSNRISSSQLKWLGNYRKQENLPRPGDMLVHEDPEPQIASGFVNLYNGQDLEGWTVRGGHSKFEATGDVIVGTCVPGSPSTYLSTNRSDYGDFVFTAEIKHVVDCNTGLMFRAAAKFEETNSKQRELVFGPQCEVEAYSKQRFWSGGIYGQSAGGWIYPMWLEAHKETRKHLKKKGDWNRVTIEAKGETMKTWLNGQPAAYWKTELYPEGFFGLQIHAGSKGIIHFRNIKVREL
ncbi:MAG: sulfatase-like hydrolase/transferase [Planctomycetota bacterium]|nr:sulfatase-like hydrolase/transferase [Planctomycetota bacterium]